MTSIPRERFHEREAAAPLPRAYQWADGSAYVNHVALVRQARGAEMPESFWTDPLMYQGGSDEILGAARPDPARRRGLGLRPRGRGRGRHRRRAARRVAARRRSAHIRLVGLVNDVSLRNLIPAELAKGFGFFQSKPASALSPVFVTPDALGERWRDGKLHGALKVDLNGQPFGRADAGEDMTFDFGTLIAHAAKTRNLGAGTIIGSGTVSNRDADGGPGKPVDRRRPRLSLPRRGAHGRDDPRRQAGDAVPQARRHGAHLDGRRAAATRSSARSSRRSSPRNSGRPASGEAPLVRQASVPTIWIGRAMLK